MIFMPACKCTFTGFSTKSKVKKKKGLKARTLSDQLSSPVRPKFWSVAIIMQEVYVLLIEALIKMLMQKLEGLSAGHISTPK